MLAVPSFFSDGSILGLGLTSTGDFTSAPALSSPELNECWSSAIFPDDEARKRASLSLTSTTRPPSMSTESSFKSDTAGVSSDCEKSMLFDIKRCESAADITSPLLLYSLLLTLKLGPSGKVMLLLSDSGNWPPRAVEESALRISSGAPRHFTTSTNMRVLTKTSQPMRLSIEPSQRARYSSMRRNSDMYFCSSTRAAAPPWRSIFSSSWRTLQTWPGTSVLSRTACISRTCPLVEKSFGSVPRGASEKRLDMRTTCPTANMESFLERGCSFLSDILSRMRWKAR
mmetsp:Transcript_42370/g.132840  ORF Transcript_42370/g.132840 Transcript_42370/m.132840 type:complete len:285 (-) Transcript_42370:3631-4485(-)